MSHSILQEASTPQPMSKDTQAWRATIASRVLQTTPWIPTTSARRGDSHALLVSSHMYDYAQQLATVLPWNSQHYMETMEMQGQLQDQGYNPVYTRGVLRWALTMTTLVTANHNGKWTTQVEQFLRLQQHFQHSMADWIHPPGSAHCREGSTMALWVHNSLSAVCYIVKPSFLCHIRKTIRM